MRPAMFRKSLNRLPVICSAVLPVQLSSVLFTRSMRPLGSSVMYPHGAFSNMSSKSSMRGSPTVSDKPLHGCDHFIGSTEIGTMPGSLKDDDLALGYGAMDKLANGFGRDDVVGALQDECWNINFRKVRP